MNRLLNIGRILYAIAFLGLGMLCIVNKDFIIGRPPHWPDSFPVNPALAYISGGAIIISSLAILVRRNGYGASLLQAGLILLLSLGRHLPHFTDDWLNAYKSLGLVGGALIIASSFAGGRSRILIVSGSVGLSIFFIACGYAHIKFYDFVKEFIPAYIPFRGFFTYFTAACLFAGGIGILPPPFRKWAALLSGWMVLGWFVLLHVPRFLSDTQNVSDRLGLCESLAFVGIFFVLASLASEVAGAPSRERALSAT